MQWHTRVHVGLHWLQSGTDKKWKSVAMQSFGSAGTGQHHPATAEMQQYSCRHLCLIKCQVCDGSCHSFLESATERKGCIWCMVNNIRWEIRRKEIKIFINSWGLQTCWSLSSVNFCWEKSNVKARKQQGHQVLLCDWFRVCAYYKPGGESLCNCYSAQKLEMYLDCK